MVTDSAPPSTPRTLGILNVRSASLSLELFKARHRTPTSVVILNTLNKITPAGLPIPISQSIETAVPPHVRGVHKALSARL
ncbi:hypothetical protein ABH935_001439 [Catenulispora sp. GAS73]|uniref:hypothetical protein n=1 Tax=Catenulispora sp. GAS73 TaxID=3156269 RepID=UPI0035192FB6